MAQPIVAFTVVEVAKPNIGENWPTRVRADVTINLNVRDHIKDEWEGNLVPLTSFLSSFPFRTGTCDLPKAVTL